jgi:hypothetical protein
MLTREATVYTEMIHENALLKGVVKGDQSFMKLY